jgi:hypothetical protein
MSHEPASTLLVERVRAAHGRDGGVLTALAPGGRGRAVLVERV